MTGRRSASIVAGWTALLVAAIVVGVVYRRGKPIEVGAVPWVGHWGFDAGLLPRLGLAAGALGIAVWGLPRVAASDRVSAVAVIATAAGTAVAVTFLLAWAGPADTHWPSLRFGYGAHTHLVDDWGGPTEFLRRYVDRQPTLTAHLRAHPPGLLLALWGFEQLGLASRTFHLVVMLAAGGIATAAALVAVRDVAGDAAVRAAAPFVAVGPVLVWRTNPDVIFAAVGLVGVALVILATGRSKHRAMFAIGGGVVFGVALLCSFGLMLLALPIAAVGAWRRAWMPLVVAGITTLVVLAAPAVVGYSWPAGLAETRVQYFDSVARIRGYRYWLLGNAAVYAALLGPAVCVGLARVRGTGARVLATSGIACAVVAGLSGLSSAETERIWQPFVPLALVAGGALWVRSEQPAPEAPATFDVANARRWLALQALVALGFQSILWTRV